MPDPLKHLRYLSIQELKPRMIGEFLLDPKIPLPIEVPGETERWNPAAISWEAIVSAMLKLLAYQPEHQHAAYYRRFVLAVNPGIREEFTTAGILKARQGELELAAEIFRALTGLFPRDASSYNNLALVYEQQARSLEAQGRPQEAESRLATAFETYKAAVRADPSLPELHLSFAHFYLRRRNIAKAREHFERFLRSNPEPEKARPVQAVLQELDAAGEVERLCAEAFDAINLDREAQAIATLRGLTARHPEVWNGWFLLGWAYRRTRQYREGREALEKADALSPGNPDTLNELAICLMELGELEASREKLSRAAELEPENPKLASNLGILALKMGDPAEARRRFEHVLDQSPGDPLAREYLQKLQSQA